MIRLDINIKDKIHTVYFPSMGEAIAFMLDMQQLVNVTINLP